MVRRKHRRAACSNLHCEASIPAGRALFEDQFRSFLQSRGEFAGALSFVPSGTWKSVSGQSFTFPRSLVCSRKDDIERDGRPEAGVFLREAAQKPSHHLRKVPSGDRVQYLFKLKVLLEEHLD